MVQLTDFEKKEFKTYEKQIKNTFPGNDMLCLTLEYFKVTKALFDFEEIHKILNYYGEYDMEIPNDDEVINAIQNLEEVLSKYMNNMVFNELKED